MDKTLFEKLQDAREQHEIAHVSFFNDGEIRSDEKYMLKLFDRANSPKEFEAIEEVFVKAAESYSRQYKFDSIEMGLILGLIFNKEDIDENNQTRENAKPIEGIVRYYTGSVKSFQDGQQTNTIDYASYAPTRQGYINFNKLISAIKRSGLSYTGPESFEEFEEQILVGEPFDITLSANFNKKEEAKTASRSK